MTDMNMIPQNIEAEQSVLGGMMLDSGMFSATKSYG